MLGSLAALATLAAFLKPLRPSQPANGLRLRASSTDVRLLTDAASEQQEPVGAAVGIDLGTTSSSIAVVRDGIAEVVLSVDGRKTMPSRVRYRADGSEPLVGEAAGDLALGSAKRLIGRTYEEVSASGVPRGYNGEPLNGVLYNCAPLNGVLYDGAPLNDVLYMSQSSGSRRAPPRVLP